MEPYVYKTDVLVIGGGVTGVLAAIESDKEGRDVVLVSKDRILGGASIQASGGISIPGLNEDRPEIFYHDTMKAGAGLNNPELVSLLADKGPSCMSILEQLGMVPDRNADGSYRSNKKTEGHSIKRSYADRRMFHEVGRVLRGNLFYSGVQVFEQVLIFNMVTKEGLVVAALAYSVKEGNFIVFQPKVVILATGGYGQLYDPSDNAEALTGECHSLALDCGAELMDMEMVQFIPLAFPFPSGMRGTFIGMCSLFGPNVKLYNGLGERFMSKYFPETMEYSTRDSVARSMFRELTENRGSVRNTIIVDPTENDPKLLETYRASTPVVYSMLERIFGEKAARWQEPFEAIPSQHFCMGGVRIDTEGRTSCPNLFAAGEISGGVHGANRLGGNALLETIIMGRIVGQTASQEAVSLNNLPEFDPSKQFFGGSDYLRQLLGNNNISGTHPMEIKNKLRKVMFEHAGIIRNDAQLNEGLTIVKQLTKEITGLQVDKTLRWNKSLLEALELKHMLKVAEAVIKSALMRTESRGSHFRDDYRETDPALAKNIVVSQDSNGELLMKFIR